MLWSLLAGRFVGDGGIDPCRSPCIRQSTPSKHPSSPTRVYREVLLLMLKVLRDRKLPYQNFPGKKVLRVTQDFKYLPYGLEFEASICFIPALWA